jgi:hypothetical protein
MTFTSSLLLATSLAGPMLADNLNAVVADSPNQASSTAKVEELHPFTHLAYIPAGADLASIRFERIKKVEAATRIKSTMDARYCSEAAAREPGGSMYCAYVQRDMFVPAYEVTYSYQAPAMTSEEYAGGLFSFSVYLREDELEPGARKAASAHKINKADMAAYFTLSTNRPLVRSVVIDEAASKFCEGNFVEGLWMKTDSHCQDQISYQTVSVPSDYVTVKVDPAGSEHKISAALTPASAR